MDKKAKNRQWILAKRPQADIKDGDLVFQDVSIPTLAPGQVLLRTEWLSLDPTNRLWMSERDQYMPPQPVGEPMRGFVIGRVVESTSDAFPVGVRAMGVGSWSDYSLGDASAFLPVPEVAGISVKDVFGIYAVVGPTAYFGLLDIGKPKIGETLVVSAAAGAVGCMAGQLGKVFGCKVIGIAGGKDKCDWITRELGMDAAIDYKAEKNLGARLRQLAPDGVDIYFDNVGGETLDTVMGQLNMYGRVIQCGMISDYNNEKPVPGPYNYARILMKRLTVQGFIVLDSYARYPEAIRAMTHLHLDGRLKWRYHDIEGLENAEKAVRLLYQGKNIGKLIVKVSAES